MERESDHFSRQHTSRQFSETDVSMSCKIHARGIQRRNVCISRLPIRRLETIHTRTRAYYDVCFIFHKIILYKIIFSTPTCPLKPLPCHWLIIFGTLFCDWLIFGTLVCDWMIFGKLTWPKWPLVNVYNTPVFRGCHSFSDIDMSNVMLNHREHRCYYNPVVGMHDISDESDKATSHPIERVPSLSGAAADREIVDVYTLEHKAVDGNTAFVVRGFVIEKVRTGVSFYIGCAYCKKANDCRRPQQSSVRKTCMRERQHLLPRQSTLRRLGHGSFGMAGLIRPVYGHETGTPTTTSLT